MTMGTNAELIELSSGAMSAVLDVERCGALSRITDDRSGNVLYRSDGFGHRLIAPGLEASQVKWLSKFHGGWDELLPNPGAARRMGAHLVDFHGSLLTTRCAADVLDRSSARLRCQWNDVLDIERTVQLHGMARSVSVRTAVRARRDTSMGWGHHIVLSATANTVVDVDSPATEREIEQFMAHSNPGDHQFWSVPTPATGTASIAPGPSSTRCEIQWPRATWPHVWIWAGNDEGRQFVGIEPCSRPDPTADSSSTDIVLRPGEQIYAALELSLPGSTT